MIVVSMYVSVFGIIVLLTFIMIITMRCVHRTRFTILFMLFLMRRSIVLLSIRVRVRCRNRITIATLVFGVSLSFT